MYFFKDGFLTSTEAQNICNVANEVIAGLTDSLNTVQFYNTTITSIVSSDNAIDAGKGTADTSWIPTGVCSLGKYPCSPVLLPYRFSKYAQSDAPPGTNHPAEIRPQFPYL